MLTLPDILSFDSHAAQDLLPILWTGLSLYLSLAFSEVQL